MEIEAWNRINERVLRGCVEGLVEEGYCGEIIYEFEQCQIVRTVHELHLPGQREPSSEAMTSIKQYWQSLSYWVNHLDDTLMYIWLQHEKITKVQNRDRVRGSSKMPPVL